MHGHASTRHDVSEGTVEDGGTVERREAAFGELQRTLTAADTAPWSARGHAPRASRDMSLNMTCSSFSARVSVKQRAPGSTLQSLPLQVVTSRRDVPRRCTRLPSAPCWWKHDGSSRLSSTSSMPLRPAWSAMSAIISKFVFSCGGTQQYWVGALNNNRWRIRYNNWACKIESVL